jgi:hypothetical protein
MKRNRNLEVADSDAILTLSLNPHTETESWQHTYVGPSGIKVRIRLATCLQPVNWESLPPTFVSCLESWNKLLPKSSASSMKLRRSAQANDSSSIVKKGLDQEEDELVMYMDVDFGAHGELLSAAPTPKQAPGASSGVVSKLVVGGGGGGGLHTRWVGSSSNTKEISFSPLPAKAPAVAVGVGVSGAREVASLSGAKRSRGNSLTSESSHHNAGGSADSVTDSTDLDVLEELHKQALMIDLQSAPINTKSWLTSTMIDALLYRFARSFPDVSFLPCSFAAFELPQAIRKGNLSSLVVRDVLGRKLPLEPEPFGPVTSVLGYNRLPTKKSVDPVHATSTATAGDSSVSLSTSFTFEEFSSSVNSDSIVGGRSSGIVSKGIKLKLVTSRTATMRVQAGGGGETSINSNNVGVNAASPALSPSTQPITSSSRSARGGQSRFPSTSDQESASSESHVVPWAGLLTRDRPSFLHPSRPIAPVYASKNKPLLFFYNAGGMHWVFVRVLMGLRKRIELYEPMGKPQKSSSRSAGVHGQGTGYYSEGLSLRSVPRPLVLWLDAVCPLATEGGWKVRSLSAITRQHQVNGFDCGVACLLYAEKSAQNFEAETICNGTEQSDITAYRRLVVNYCNGNAKE